MSRYDAILLELLRRLDEKAGRLISLLEVRQNQERVIQVTGMPESENGRAHLAGTIRDTLASQYQVHNSKQQPDPTSQEQMKAEGCHLDEPDP